MGTLNQMWANHQLTSLSVADQAACLSVGRTDGQTNSSPARLPAAAVLTLHVAGLLLARLSTLVEGKLSGKEVLFTLVIERLLRKRSEVGEGESEAAPSGGYTLSEATRTRTGSGFFWCRPTHTARGGAFATLDSLESRAPLQEIHRVAS